MTDDFVKKAFEDATKSTSEKEFKAFHDRIIKNIGTITMACGFLVGMDKMEKLSSAVIKAGVQETFAELMRNMMTIAFSEGYKTKAEETE